MLPGRRSGALLTVLGRKSGWVAVRCYVVMKGVSGYRVAGGHINDKASVLPLAVRGVIVSGLTNTLFLLPEVC